MSATNLQWIIAVCIVCIVLGIIIAQFRKNLQRMRVILSHLTKGPASSDTLFNLLAENNLGCNKFWFFNLMNTMIKRRMVVGNEVDLLGKFDRIRVTYLLNQAMRNRALILYNIRSEDDGEF